MFGGTKYAGSIHVKDHPKADIYVDGNKIGTGLAIQYFRRNQALTVEVRQDGCENKFQTFDKTLRTGNFILSAFAWGLAGIVVDIASGGAFKPNHKGNLAVEKMSEKNYLFTIDYSECPVSR